MVAEVVRIILMTKYLIIAVVCEAILLVSFGMVKSKAVLFDGEPVRVKMPDFSGTGRVLRSQLKGVQGANGLVLCYEIKFDHKEGNVPEKDAVWIPRKFVASKLKWFERRDLLKR